MFSWEIKDGKLEEAEKFSLLSEYMEDSFTEGLNTIPPERIKEAAQTILNIANGSGIKSTNDIDAKNILKIILSLIQIYKEKENSNENFSIIIKSLIKSFFSAIDPEKNIIIFTSRY